MDKSKDIQKIYEKGKSAFERGSLKSYKQRINALNRIEYTLRKHEDAIYLALKKDLNKSRYEAFLTEMGLVYSELRNAKKKLKFWMMPDLTLPSLSQMPGLVKVHKEPYGCVLVLSPWNYPLQLSITPIIAAISAGNTVVLKPSAYSENTSKVLDKILTGVFLDSAVQVVTGSREENQSLLEQPFDYIFFTGSPTVGKEVMKKASRNLTPVTLELGGKSPTIVDKTADINKTAKRILFGKLMNAGQTCIAPDYVMVHKDVKDQLIYMLKAYLNLMFTEEEYKEKVYPKIINKKHFSRLQNLIQGEKILWGGEIREDTLQIDLTLLDSPSWDSPVMKEEIFGPVLPIIAYQDIDELIQMQKKLPKPLALYLFTKDRRVQNKVLRELSYGGGCINDTLLHFSTHRAPFGGVGKSGIGSYHGKYGFDTFTHKKTVLKKSWYFDPPMKYHPYKDPDATIPEIFMR